MGDADRTLDLAGEDHVTDKATVVAAVGDHHSVISEGGFVAGIRCASSPQPGSSSANPGGGLRMQDASGGMSTNPAPRPGPSAVDSDSSDLPSLSLPAVQTHDFTSTGACSFTSALSDIHKFTYF